jgi:hypothetical protein
MVKAKLKTIHSFYKITCGEAEPELNNENPTPLPLVEPEPPQTQQDEEQGTNEVTFQGVGYLEQDPGLHPQIWQYPLNQRDDVVRAYLKLGPMQPLLQNYEASGVQGHQRRFKYNWFSIFPYSESKNRAYCFYCFLRSMNRNKRGGSDVFTVHGFNNWKKVNDGKKCAFLSHVGSDHCSVHNNAVTECRVLLNQPGLDNVVEARTQQELEDNRLRLKTSVAAVKWLADQACAFRGNDDCSVKEQRKLS